MLEETVHPWQEKRQEEDDDSKKFQEHVSRDLTFTHKTSFLEGSVIC